MVNPDKVLCLMPWPYSLPAGLRRRLEAVLSQRSYGAPEVWAEVVDWLNANGVEMPEGVEMERPPEVGAQRDQ